MAPNISGKSTSSAKINREKKKLFSNYNKQLNKIKSEIEKNFTYVGKNFQKRLEKFIMVKRKINLFMERQLKKKVKNWSMRV